MRVKIAFAKPVKELRESNFNPHSFAYKFSQSTVWLLNSTLFA